MSATHFESAPSIRIRNPSIPQDQPHAASRHSAAPMSIPNKKRDTPPPPLPPPRFIEGLNDKSGGQQWHSDDQRGMASVNAAAIRPGSSLLGGHSPRHYAGPERSFELRHDQCHHQTQSQPQSATSPRSPDLSSADAQREARIPDLAALLEFNSNSKLQGERQMGQRHLESSSQAYDKSVLQRIGGPRTPPRSSGGASAVSNAGDDPSTIAQNTLQRLNGQLKPLSLPPAPERRHSSNESSAGAQRWSAGAPPASPGMSGLRSPFSDTGIDQRHGLRRANSSSVYPAHPAYVDMTPRHDGYDRASEYAVDEPSPSDGPKHGRSPQSDGYQQDTRVGQKRRALSPPVETVLDPRLPGPSAMEDWATRAQQIGRQNATAQAARDAARDANRLHAQQGSLSSSNSSLPPGVASYPSSYGVSAPSSATSYNSGRISPSSYSEQQHARTPSSLHSQQLDGQIDNNGSPMRNDSSRAPPIPHRRTGSTGVPRPGLWICDCCPKKPKKFENEQELRVHESEKQYVCAYCNNRFKNKNEAERHQNSLHLRKHSWSCASLTSFEMAFHATPGASMAPPNGAPGHSSYPPPPQTDTCGYCGEQFVNNPPNWDERVEHLNHVHKFGECNQSKKFFRADHFRQHLKHSHGGTSGKWTNMLENACMRDEPLPQPINHNIGLPQHQSGAPMAMMTPGQHIPPRRLDELRQGP